MFKSKVQKGIEIFTEAWGAWSMTAEHDQIWIYPEVGYTTLGDFDDRQKLAQEQIVPEAKLALMELGWFKEEDMGWSHYV